MSLIDDTADKANDLAESGTQLAKDTKDDIKDGAENLGKRISNAAEDVKQDFTSSEPRPRP